MSKNSTPSGGSLVLSAMALRAMVRCSAGVLHRERWAGGRVGGSVGAPQVLPSGEEDLHPPQNIRPPLPYLPYHLHTYHTTC